MNEYLMIGEVLRPQGIHGEAKVRPYAADPEAFYDWDTLYIQEKDGYRPVTAVCSRVHDGFAYVTLDGCETPEAVDRLRGTRLWIDRDHACELAEGEVYITDLIGCRAVDENGTEVGVLKDVLQHGAADVYVFRTKRGGMMAPALKAVFPAIDLENRVISVVSARLNEVAVFED